MKRTVINGGHLIDPANKISSKLNIAIENGKIAAISNTPLEGDKVIDAEELIVSPGFIDCHMHEDKYDKQEDKFNISIFECMLRMGVTTAIGGNCGGGPRDIPSYIDAVNRIGIPINLGMLVPHSTLRALEGLNNKYESASHEEIKIMRKRAEEYIDMGLLGVSFGIRYIPGLTEKELIDISSVCKKDNKIVAAHIRDDAKNVFSAIKEFMKIGEELEIPLQVSHIGSMGAYGQMEELLSILDDKRTKGLNIAADCYPYNAFSTGIGQTTYDEGFLDRYNTTYESIEIAEGKYKGQRCNKEIFNELRLDNPSTITIGHVMKDEEVDIAIMHPNVLIASDGLMPNYQGHPRAAGTFPRMISKYVREKKLLSLYSAIEKMTSLPAKRFGLRKGSLGIGDDGDIVIFDYNKIKDNATFENPALSPDGIKYVLINGEIAMKNNEIRDLNLGRFVTSDN